MTQDEVAKNLLAGIGCVSCHFCVKGSLSAEDWLCEFPGENKHSDVPKDLTCEKWLKYSTDSKTIIDHVAKVMTGETFTAMTEKYQKNWNGKTLKGRGK